MAGSVERAGRSPDEYGLETRAERLSRGSALRQRTTSWLLTVSLGWSALLGCGQEGLGEPGADGALPLGEARAEPSLVGEVFWNGVTIFNLEGHATFAELSDAAELAVVGRFSGIEAGRREVFDDGADTTFVYGVAAVQVNQVLRGSAPDELVIEVLLGIEPDGTASDVEALSENLPQEDLVLLLRENTDPQVPVQHRLLNATGLWVAKGGSFVPRTSFAGGVAAPKASDGGASYSSELAAFPTLDDLAAFVAVCQSGCCGACQGEPALRFEL